MKSKYLIELLRNIYIFKNINYRLLYIPVVNTPTRVDLPESTFPITAIFRLIIL